MRRNQHTETRPVCGYESCPCRRVHFIVSGGPLNDADYCVDGVRVNIAQDGTIRKATAEQFAKLTEFFATERARYVAWHAEQTARYNGDFPVLEPARTIQVATPPAPDPTPAARMTANQARGLKMYDEGQRGPFGLAGDSQRDTRQHIMHLLNDLMTKPPKDKCGVTALDAAVKSFRESHPAPPAEPMFRQHHPLCKYLLRGTDQRACTCEALNAADHFAPMAEERDTAQWYVVNSEMSEIRAIVGEKRGRGWTTLGDDIRNALRRELARIRAQGEALDIAAGRNPQTGDALPSSAYQPHAFTGTGDRCAVCTLRAGNPVHLLPLPGMESADEERADARAAAQGQTLTAAMREPIRDISVTAGNMERNSPLFYGLADNPTLFN